MSVSIIINPISGGARPAEVRRRIDRAAQALRAAGERGEVVVSQHRGHARQLASAALDRGARLMIAWGGDGTVNEIASALVHRPAALGIVRSGSGNGLARELGVSRRPERAIAEAIAAAPRSIDVGELGGRVFVTIAGVGFDAHVAACFDRDKGRRGLAPYVRIVARELWGYKPATYRLDDARDPREALLVTFANAAQFGNGARISPHARIDDGLLDLVVFEEVSRLSTVWGLPRLFTGRVSRLRGVSVQQVERATIECDRPMAFHVDGEPVCGGNRLEARVIPAALQVAVR